VNTEQRKAASSRRLDHHLRHLTFITVTCGHLPTIDFARFFGPNTASSTGHDPTSGKTVNNP
jgi:hypothetical protein